MHSKFLCSFDLKLPKYKYFLGRARTRPTGHRICPSDNLQLISGELHAWVKKILQLKLRWVHECFFLVFMGSRKEEEKVLTTISTLGVQMTWLRTFRIFLVWVCFVPSISTLPPSSAHKNWPYLVHQQFNKYFLSVYSVPILEINIWINHRN